VAVTDVRMRHHPRQVADDPRGAQVAASGRIPGGIEHETKVLPDASAVTSDDEP
jgi:hypothetical protein